MRLRQVPFLFKWVEQNVKLPRNQSLKQWDELFCYELKRGNAQWIQAKKAGTTCRFALHDLEGKCPLALKHYQNVILRSVRKNESTLPPPLAKRILFRPLYFLARSSEAVDSKSCEAVNSKSCEAVNFESSEGKEEKQTKEQCIRSGPSDDTHPAVEEQDDETVTEPDSDYEGRLASCSYYSSGRSKKSTSSDTSSPSAALLPFKMAPTRKITQLRRVTFEKRANSDLGSAAKKQKRIS